MTEPLTASFTLSGELIQKIIGIGVLHGINTQQLSLTDDGEGIVIKANQQPQTSLACDHTMAQNGRSVPKLRGAARFPANRYSALGGANTRSSFGFGSIGVRRRRSSLSGVFSSMTFQKPSFVGSPRDLRGRRSSSALQFERLPKVNPSRRGIDRPCRCFAELKQPMPIQPMPIVARGMAFVRAWEATRAVHYPNAPQTAAYPNNKRRLADLPYTLG